MSCLMATVGQGGLIVSGLFAPYPHQQFSFPGCQPIIASQSRRWPRVWGIFKQCPVPTVTSCPNLPIKSTQWLSHTQNLPTPINPPTPNAALFICRQLLRIRHFLILINIYLSRGLIWSHFTPESRRKGSRIEKNLPFTDHWGFPGGSAGKESACNEGELGLIPGLGRSLEKEKAIHSSILAWRIPWTEEPGGLQSMGSQNQTQLSSLFCLWNVYLSSKPDFSLL